ncbi:MAG: hydroxyacid dehydrogenase, partial [Candidatus Omnitrophota bacterium]
MSETILISTSTFAEFDRAPRDLLERNGFRCVLNPYRRKLVTEETIRLGKDAVGMIAGTERLDETVFSGLGKLKAVSRCGAGMDNVDMDSAR